MVIGKVLLKLLVRSQFQLHNQALEPRSTPWIISFKDHLCNYYSRRITEIISKGTRFTDYWTFTTTANKLKLKSVFFSHDRTIYIWPCVCDTASWGMRDQTTSSARLKFLVKARLSNWIRSFSSSSITWRIRRRNWEEDTMIWIGNDTAIQLTLDDYSKASQYTLCYFIELSKKRRVEYSCYQRQLFLYLKRYIIWVILECVRIKTEHSK